MDSFALFLCFCALVAIAAAAIFYYRLRTANAENKKILWDLRMLESAIDSSSHGLVFMDPQGKIIRVNLHAANFIPALGDPHSAVRTFQDVLSYMFDYAVEGDESLENAAAKAPLTRGEGAGFREILRLADGRYYLAQAQKTGFGTVIIISDITRQRRREEDLMRLNRVNRDLISAVEETTNGIIISDPKRPGNPIIFVNEGFSRDAGIPKAGILGRGWTDLLGEIGDSRAVSLVREIGTHRKPVDIEFQRASDNASVGCYTLRISPTFDRIGRIDLFIGILTDITDLRLREAQLSQAQKLDSLGRLAGGVAHDFNNVLSIIDGYTRLSMNALDKDSPVAAHLLKVLKAVERGASLTRQLLTFGRRKVVVESVVDLGQILREQKTMLKPLLGASFVLDVNIPEEKLYVECAEDEVGQIVMNLVINGRDAMEGGGRITVESAPVEPGKIPAVIPESDREKPFVRLSVIDSGTGMPEETVKKIFDPFFTTKGAGKGTGLGLSIVYGMVRNMHGYIEVDSHLGEGTRMNVYLPLTEKRPEAGLEKKISMEAGKIRFDGYTALVAEDEPDLLDLVSGMLERLGMRVLKASNGNEALAVQDECSGPIDFLVTDVVMPELNGVKLAELFLALRPDTKVVFMSGYPASGDLAPVDLPQDAYFMAKPISYDALAMMLRERIEGGDSGELRQAQGTTRHWN